MDTRVPRKYIEKQPATKEEEILLQWVVFVKEGRHDLERRGRRED